MMKIIAAVAIAVLYVGTAKAETGAELLQDDFTFGLGFVWGATTYMINDLSTDEAYNRLTLHRSSCLAKAKITGRTMYDAVIQEIRSDPALLAMPASHAVQRVTFKICGAPPTQQ